MKFKLKEKDIKKVIEEKGACIVSNEILVDGKMVGYMYRENPSINYNDTGWRFFSGYETEEYCENANNFSIVELSTLCNYDSSVIEKINSDICVAYKKNKSGAFIKEKFNPNPEK